MYGVFIIFCIVLVVLAFITRVTALSRLAPGLGVLTGALLGLAYSGDILAGAGMGAMAAGVYVLFRVALKRP